MIIQAPDLQVLRRSHKNYRPRSFIISEPPMLFEWLEKKRIIEVPKGFITDFASIPGFLRDRFAVNDDHRLAAVAHDYLYSQSGIIKQLGRDITYTRKEADQIFYKLMLTEGVGRFKAWLMYRAVRSFGSLYSGEWANG